MSSSKCACNIGIRVLGQQTNYVDDHKHSFPPPTLKYNPSTTIAHGKKAIKLSKRMNTNVIC